MNIRQILALGTGAVFSLSLGTGVAFAQGPDSEECDNARKNVVTLETQVTNVAAEENVRERAALEAAREALNDAQKTLRDLEEATPPPSREAVQTARQAVQTARDVRDARQRDLDTDSNRLAGLRAQLRLAIEDRDETCADPEPTPAPTTTNPPPTTVTVVPPPPVVIDNDDDAPVPSGGVDTGDGSSL